MANPPKKEPKEPKEPKEIELLPNAWERFEGFIKKAANTPPQHRESKPAKGKKQPKKKGS